MAPSLLALTLLLSPAQTKSEPPKPPPAKAQRLVHPVRGGDPAALAEVLGRHAPNVTVSAAGPVLVLSGPAEAVADAAKLLDQLDRQPRTVVVEVTLADVTLRKPDEKTDGADSDPAELVGKIDELARTGRATVQRLRLTAAEGQAVTTQTGGNKPFTTGVARGGFGGGPAQRSVSYQSIGATVKLTARTAADGVMVDLSVQDSAAKPAEGDDPPALDTTALTTRVSVPPGKPVVAQAVRRDGKPGKTVALVIVTARVIEPGATAGR